MTNLLINHTRINHRTSHRLLISIIKNSNPSPLHLSSYPALTEIAGVARAALLVRRLSSNLHHDVPLSLQDRGLKPDPKTLQKLLATGVRPYFYFIDVHGQVFLQDTSPKNFTSCYKDPKFLNFFISRIRQNSSSHFPEYQWQSPCGKEINFVESADTPIVFHGLQNGQLLWAGNLRTPFLPDQLRVSSTTGRIYHPLPTPLRANQEQSANSETPRGCTLGLVKSSLVLSDLAANLDEDSLVWQGERFNLHHVQ